MSMRKRCWYSSKTLFTRRVDIRNRDINDPF